MASRSPSQSDGEVFSSDSEAKAKSIPSFHNNSKVDRHTRPYSTSHSTAPRANRSRSRSPYRAPRGEKRLRDYDHSRKRSDNDPRTFAVRYEDDRRHRGHGSYEQRGAKRSKRYSRSRSRSRSPYRHLRVDDAERAKTKTVADISGKSEGDLRRGSRQAEISAASTSRQPEHVSNSGAAATQVATGELDTSRDTPDGPNTVPKGDVTNEVPKTVDEAALIEERRRRREAIKNKYRGQAPPLLVQALHLGADSRTGSPAVESYPTTPGRSGKFLLAPSPACFTDYVRITTFVLPSNTERSVRATISCRLQL